MEIAPGCTTDAPSIVFKVVASDPVVHLELALDGLGIAILPLYMVKSLDARKRLMPILPLWNPEPITLCALFSGPARLNPKVQVLLDFPGEYIGTDRDPRLLKVRAKGPFTTPKLEETSARNTQTLIRAPSCVAELPREADAAWERTYHEALTEGPIRRVE